MGKVLFFVLIGVIVWLLFFSRLSAHLLKRDRRSEAARKDQSRGPEPMRECMHCGVYLPASDAAEMAGQRGKFSCINPAGCGNRPR